MLERAGLRDASQGVLEGQVGQDIRIVATEELVCAAPAGRHTGLRLIHPHLDGLSERLHAAGDDDGAVLGAILSAHPAGGLYVALETAHPALGHLLFQTNLGGDEVFTIQAAN